MARIRQIRDVISVRTTEDRERSLTYKEIEVRAVTAAIHSAAGNRAGARAAQKFRFHKKEPAQVSETQMKQMFPADEQGMFSAEEILAEAERQKALQKAGA